MTKKEETILTLNEYRKQNKINYPKWNALLKAGLPTNDGTVNKDVVDVWIKNYDVKEKEDLAKYNEENVSRQQKRNNANKESRESKSERRS